MIWIYYYFTIYFRIFILLFWVRLLHYCIPILWQIQDIDGLDIHFVHVKAKRTKANLEVKPLLLLHGWPGSFYEFYGAIPHLTDPANTGVDFGMCFYAFVNQHHSNFIVAYDLVIPSLPGFGFSQATLKKG